jgi:hypothetical protein
LRAKGVIKGSPGTVGPANRVIHEGKGPTGEASLVEGVSSTTSGVKRSTRESLEEEGFLERATELLGCPEAIEPSSKLKGQQ